MIGRPTAPPHNKSKRERARVSWISLIRTARVPYGFLLLIALGLLLPGQMRDMLAALTNSSELLKVLAFPLSLAGFGFTCWYWSRAAISARFDLPDTKSAWDQAVLEGSQGRRPALTRAPLHLVPQAPIPITGLIGLMLAFRSGAYLSGIEALVALLVLWWVVDKRRPVRDRLRAWAKYPPLNNKLPNENGDMQSTSKLSEWRKRAGLRFAKLLQRAPFGPRVAGVALGLSLFAFLVSALCSLFPASSIDDPRNWIWTMFQGPTPVLVGCALMIAPLTAISFVADGWRPTVRILGAPVGLNRPPIMSVLVLVSIAVPLHFTLHPVRTLPLPMGGRTTLLVRWTDWKAGCGPNTRPIIVAISGGASRAGLWGASVLSEVEKQVSGRNAAVFAISSVSGGSLGAAAYMGTRAEEPEKAGQAVSCQMQPALLGKFGSFALQLGSADEIGPLLSGYVFSDVPRALLGWLPAMMGFNLQGGDRAAAIERSFEANAETASSGKLAVTPFDRPFLSLTSQKKKLPLWIANGTERDTGSRALTIAVDSVRETSRSGETDAATLWPFKGASDVIAQLDNDVPISTAINNTARFPFLEPAGKLSSKKFGDKTVSVIDGGYFDNSGLETALELAAWLKSQGASPIVVAATGDGDGNGVTTRLSKIQPSQIVRCGSAAYQPGLSHTTADVAEVVAPLVGLNDVRAGHVDVLLRQAADEYCASEGQSFFHFYLGARGAESVPLNWVLSKTMACHIWISSGNESLPECTDADTIAHDAFVDANILEAERLKNALVLAPPASR